MFMVFPRLSLTYVPHGLTQVAYKTFSHHPFRILNGKWEIRWTNKFDLRFMWFQKKKKHKSVVRWKKNEHPLIKVQHVIRTISATSKIFHASLTSKQTVLFVVLCFCSANGYLRAMQSHQSTIWTKAVLNVLELETVMRRRVLWLITKWITFCGIVN